MGQPVSANDLPDGGVPDWDLPNKGKPTSKKDHAWADVPGAALRNIPASATNFVGSIYEAVTHPVDTAKNVLDATTGAGINLMPDWLKTGITAIEGEGGGRFPKASAQRAEDTADAVGGFYKDRYGNMQNVRNTLATDPVGALADVSTVAAGGAGALKVAGMPKAANATMMVSNATNPVNAVKPVVKAAGTTAKNVFGTTTGVGPENVSQAYRAGKTGNQAFMQNLTGQASMTDVLERAKHALQKMRADRMSDYRENIGKTSANQKPLDFTQIDKALNETVASMRSGNHWKIGTAEQAKLQELANVVDEWRADPSMHTAMGLDSLKQRLDALYPDSPMQKQVQRAVTSVRNATKDTIVKQSPEYADTMAAYEEALTLEREIEKALSLNSKASADTALRKLQSLSRNNVNTNYGNRLNLARELEKSGGVDLMPSISGQAMSSWTPRGLAQLSQAGLGGYGVMAQEPLVMALLAAQSPKAVGFSAYGAGRAANLANRTLTPEQAALAALLAGQSGQIPAGQSQ